MTSCFFPIPEMKGIFRFTSSWRWERAKIVFTILVACWVIIAAQPGNIYTFAGVGNVFGDGGPATAALLKNPYGLAFASSGDLYVVDQANYVVRKV